MPGRRPHTQYGSRGVPRKDERRAPSGSPPRKFKRSPVAFIARLAVIALLAAGVVFKLMEGGGYYIASISLDKESVSLFVGESLTMEASTVSFGKGEQQLEWSSAAPEAASVDETGTVQALAAGQTTITVADARSGRQAQCEVMVYDTDQMVLGFYQTTMGVGEQSSLTVQMGAQSTGAAEFVSSDSDIVAVDEVGRLSAVAPGTTQITVSSRGFEDASCEVTVLPAPTAIEISSSGNMCAGETRTLTVSMSDLEFSSAMEYSSSDPSVVTVDGEGTVKAVAQGSASVTIKAHNGVSCTLPVTVGKEPSSVEVDDKITVYSGRPIKLGATDNTGSCEEYYYVSSDPSVLMVGEDGLLHALKRGSATVTCTSYNGKSADCKVTTRIVDYQNPYSSQIVFDNIAALEATYPDIIKTSSIGKSVQGRDITLLTLGTGERKVLIVAGIHSKESIAVTFTMRCIEEYAQAMTAGKNVGRYNVKKLLSEFTIYFVPLMNPDGMDIYLGLEQPEYTDQPLTEEELSDFKNNANGVNLNRNFPFEWGHEKVNTTTPDSRSYAGASAASEPETQALIALCEANEFEWMFNMHCKGHMVFYQDEVNETTQQSINMAARLAGRCDFVLNDESTPYEISGGFENWFRKQYGKAGLCVEMVESKYSIAVNHAFDRKVQWDITKGVFLMCLGQ